MSHARRAFVAIATVMLLAVGRQAGAEPLFTLTEDGQTFLYRARPGDRPATVAEMFGIPARDLPGFLAANGIADPTRVGAGFVYRIPNTPARTLAERAAALEAENARLGRSLAGEKERVQGLARAAEEASGEARRAEDRAARLARLETLWPWVKTLLVLVVLAGVGAAYTAVAAIRRQAGAERYARALARELEEKRKAVLGERQESARRTLDLETRVRALEAQLGPRVVISGRGN